MKGFIVPALLAAIILQGNPAAAQGVSVKDIKHLGVSCLLLANEKTGVVVPKDPEPGSPQNQFYLAPIQAVRFADGTFSDPELNYLEPASDYSECSTYAFFTDGRGGKDIPVKKRTLTIVKRTADEIVLSIKYNFAKAENEGTHDRRGQSGYYTCTISLKAGEPVVMIEEESDYNFSYQVETGRNLFNQARYRGRYSPNPEYGYMIENGQKKTYLNENAFPGREATVDLLYDAPVASCKPYHHYPALEQWNIWPNLSGWYWQLYNASGSAQSPTIAIFHGRASRLIGASCAMVNFFTRSDNRASGIRVNINRVNPSRYYTPVVRVQWGLYQGTRGVDIVAYDQTSPLLKWFNKKSGMADKILQYEKQVPAPAAEFEWASFYQDKEAIQQMIKKARQERPFTQFLTSFDNSLSNLFNAWGGDACASEKTYHTLKTHYELFKELMTNGQGIYSYTISKKFSGACQEPEVGTSMTHFTRASDWFWRDVLTAGALMAASNAGSIKLSATQKDTLKLLSGVYARVMWDDDFVPMQYTPKGSADTLLDVGVNYGGENLYVTYRAGRDFFALLYRNDPFFKPKYDGIVARCKKTIADIISVQGASRASPHYTGPTFEDLVLLLLHLKQLGNNFFETEPRLKAFAQFYLNLLTPPNVRFADNRKLVSFGDGSEESGLLFGLLASGFRSGGTGPAQLVADLDAAYQNGPMRSINSAGIMALVYDFSKTTNTRNIGSLKSNTYPGYLSNFRSAANTPLETSVWMLNGNHYYDHRNDDDGEISLYALRTPISLSRSSLYEPFANAATIRSMVVPLKNFPSWNGNAQPINYGSEHRRTWIQSSLNRYADFTHAGFSSITMGKDENKWNRDLLFYHGNDNYPVIIIKDELSSREPHIWSMPFFSEGNIVLPDRNTVRTGPADNCVTKLELPNAASVNGRTEWPLQNDWNRFAFTGQEWRNYDPQHNVNGTDWWLYTYNQGNEVTAAFTEWTNFYIPGPEMQEYEKTHPYKFPKNCVEKAPNIHYREKQQIIRFKGRGRFSNIIMPFRKGEAPANVSVKQTGTNQFTITRMVNGVAEAIEISNDAIVMQSAPKTVITTLGTNAGYSGSTGITVTGGVAELVWEGNKMQVTVPLNSGNRTIILPGAGWKIPNPPSGVSLALSGNRLTIITGKDNGNASANANGLVTLNLAR